MMRRRPAWLGTAASVDGEGEAAGGAWSGGRGLRVGGSDGTAVLASSMVLGAAGCCGAVVE